VNPVFSRPRHSYLLQAAALLAAVVCHGAAAAQARTDSAVFLYGGQWSANRFGEILSLRTEFQSSYLGVLGASRVLRGFNEHLHLEGEVNVARHWGRQDHFEINMAASVRWKSFPWDSVVDTSFAHGFGPSYAFDRPPIETRGDRPASRGLVFMVTEFALAPPGSGSGSWEGFVRIHHRSGAYDVVSRASGSNFVTTGFRYRF
jgi:hypothetical protein